MSLQLIFRSGRNMNRNYSCRIRMMSTSTIMEPWLMLAAPKSKSWDDHKLYSLGEKKVISIKKKEAPPPAWAQGERVIHLGCTHGWMASFNRDNQHTFLSNPITARHMRLPALPVPTSPDRIILTYSPDAHDCRAIITYYQTGRIALCFPGHSTANWLPVCNQLHYLDIAYSIRHKRLFCLTCDSVVECWDLQSPSFVWKVPLFDDSDSEEDDMIDIGFSYPKYLVMDEHSDRLFLVIRDVLGHVGRDGSHMKSIYSLGNDYPYKTLSFDVYEIDPNKGTLTYMEASLDGLAMFVGANHSFALPAADFNLTPDSIYFVEHFNEINYGEIMHGGHDIGIFNYVDTKLSSVYYPSHPSQIWMKGKAPALDEKAQAKFDEMQLKAHSAMILCLGYKVLGEVQGETTASGILKRLDEV
ncbi:uncharacterized protein LOC125195164 [Salvia hispanica]|uniref:uncharacterized protein LOC125195164 n=1 Tax=Salvia hispanica TaxID=49212 RepID=UPI0020094854|nr:uncharacterized protein LOC125195164 [Salvia hispanica]